MKTRGRIAKAQRGVCPRVLYCENETLKSRGKWDTKIEGRKTRGPSQRQEQTKGKEDKKSSGC